MRQNSQLHLYIETEFREKLLNEARIQHLSLSELCRLKLGMDLDVGERLKRIEDDIEYIKIGLIN
ncbi:MAG: hypothetical protein ACI83O_000380 [Patescibacteria group bacterium]|jgi:hypothetical protein